MIVKKLSLTNFRNYRSESIIFSNERNVIVGENAQGKTNLLEAIEYCATGRSYRTALDGELIRKESDNALVELDFFAGSYDRKISIGLKKRLSSKGETTEKAIKVNGVAKANTRGLQGHLAVVGFKSEDMSLIRGGPKDRRDWLDDLACLLKTGFSAVLSRYQKALAQRNRLLKSLFEKGRLSVSDQDQLKAWDQQIAALGATIIKKRIECLLLVLPIAERYQKDISGIGEHLSANYSFYISPSLSEGTMHAELDSIESFSMNALADAGEQEIAVKLMKLYRIRRGDEISRRQTLSGPHRDDVRFNLNSTDATSFASQGQQRSLVLALKLAELELVSNHLEEPPVLILDDVMAELDLKRQAYLMETINNGMQTILTTTHLESFGHFQREWLSGSSLISVRNGEIERQENFATPIK